jgi:hypothetical protein
MGGFVSRSDRRPIITSHQLRDVPEYLADIQAVRAQDIKDKSKGDALSKGVAVTQQLWFTTQCLARVHQHLPVTQLELVTLAFAVVNIFISLLWLHKPLDVEEPLMVGLEDALSAEGDVNPPKMTFWGWMWGSITGIYPDYNQAASTSVPPFWSSDLEDRNFLRIFGYLQDPSLIMGCLVGTVFGAIHSAAWHADFPTTEERKLWRSCSLVISVVPFIVIQSITNRQMQTEIYSSLKWTTVFTFSIYIIARTMLIVLAFIAFRALPPGTFVDANWSVYIPHL